MGPTKIWLNTKPKKKKSPKTVRPEISPPSMTLSSKKKRLSTQQGKNK